MGHDYIIAEPSILGAGQAVMGGSKRRSVELLAVPMARDVTTDGLQILGGVEHICSKTNFF